MSVLFALRTVVKNVLRIAVNEVVVIDTGYGYLLGIHRVQIILPKIYSAISLFDLINALVIAHLCLCVCYFTIHFVLRSKSTLIGYRSLYGSKLVVLGRASLISKIVYCDVLINYLSACILLQASRFIVQEILSRVSHLIDKICMMRAYLTTISNLHPHVVLFVRAYCL